MFSLNFWVCMFSYLEISEYTGRTAGKQDYFWGNGCVLNHIWKCCDWGQKETTVYPCLCCLTKICIVVYGLLLTSVLWLLSHEHMFYLISTCSVCLLKINVCWPDWHSQLICPSWFNNFLSTNLSDQMENYVFSYCFRATPLYLMYNLLRVKD